MTDETKPEFFLALAVKGKDEWNKWRKANTKHVTLDGADFSQTRWEAIEFSGFEFGDNANFSECKWRGFKPVENPKPNFEPGQFMPGQAFFFGVVFGDSASFKNAIFGDMAGFYHTTFGDRASFARGS